MEKSRIIADGDKLRAIRKKYGLKQDEISGNDITRNLISEIETGAANITKKTAEIIIKNLKEMASKKGFKVTETVEYLMENQVVQATKILDNYITKLKRLLISKDDSFIETLKTAKSFLADWNINEKAITIYEVAGDYFYIQNEMYESIMYYEKALTAVGKLVPSQELLQIFSKILAAYIHAGNYDKAIENATFVIEHFDNLATKDLFHFAYNRAWTYYLIRKYELALAYIDKLEKVANKEDKQNYFILLDTKAVCFCETKRYEEALRIYNTLLNILDDSDLNEKIIVHINIAETYLAQLEKDKAAAAFKIVQDELPFLESSKQEANIYFEVGNIFRNLGDAAQAYNYYNKAVNIAKAKKNYVLLNTVLETMLENTNNIDIVNNIKNEALTLVAKQEKIYAKLIHKLLVFYADNNDINSIREISSFTLKFVA